MSWMMSLSKKQKCIFRKKVKHIHAEKKKKKKSVGAVIAYLTTCILKVAIKM